MGYLKKAFEDKLFLQINHFLWSIPFFLLALWMLDDFKKIIDEPFQLVGLIILLSLGIGLIYKAMKTDTQHLKASSTFAISDIFMLIFAAFSFIPAILIWETLKKIKQK